jgi:hypothetical protein
MGLSREGCERPAAMAHVHLERLKHTCNVNHTHDVSCNCTRDFFQEYLSAQRRRYGNVVNFAEGVI